MNKVQKSDLGINFAGFPEEQRKFLEKMCDMVCDTVNKAIEGSASTDEVETKFKTINDSIKGYDAEKFAQVIKDNEELRDVVKSLTEGLEKIKQKGVDVNPIYAKAEEAIQQMFESEKFKQFDANTTRDARGFVIKDISMTGNYTGTHLITAQSGDIASQVKNKPQHIRDYAAVLPGDPEMLSFSWQIIEELERNARYVSENGMLPESSMKMREESSSVKRVGHYFKLSKRALKSRVFLSAFILTQAVNGVLNAEDFGILFGDGSGDNLKGITKFAGCQPVETIISNAVVTGAAGTVDSVEAAGNGLIVTFKTSYDLMQEGMKITFAGAVTNTGINGIHDIIKLNDRQILLEGKAFASGSDAEKLATDVAALTWTVTSGARNSVESPNSIDALETAVAVMTYAQYRPSVILLNPITLNSIRAEKATNGNRLEVVRDLGGNPIIGGLRVLECTDIPVGKYFVGDFVNGCKILEYTGLTLDWADDVNTKLKNQIVLMAQEELILAVENPWAFAYGSIAALKTAIAKS